MSPEQLAKYVVAFAPWVDCQIIHGPCLANPAAKVRMFATCTNWPAAAVSPEQLAKYVVAFAPWVDCQIIHVPVPCPENHVPVSGKGGYICHVYPNWPAAAVSPEFVAKYVVALAPLG